MSRTELKELGEFALIDHLTQEVAIHHQETILGIGDDAAVIENKDICTLVGTDLLIEGIHFDLMYHPLKHLGYKAVIVNLSGYSSDERCSKTDYRICSRINRFSVEALNNYTANQDSLQSLQNRSCRRRHHHFTKSCLIISVTVIGTQQKEKIVKRNGAKPGDYILCHRISRWSLPWITITWKREKEFIRGTRIFNRNLVRTVKYLNGFSNPKREWTSLHTR